LPTSLIVFLNQDLKAAEAIVKVFQDEFETSLKDTFSEDELVSFEAKIDALSAVFVQPIFSELSFDDFTPSQEHKDRQRDFFYSSRSSLSFENLPFLETNPIQVSYLKELIDKFDQCLVDRGGNEELLFKEYFLNELCAYRDLSSLLGVALRPKPQTQKKFIPIDPIDFLIVDVYNELDRLKNHALPLDIAPEKLRKLFRMMKEEKLMDQSLLFQRSGLNAKDFDDGLERLKFILKKIGH
jgi:hypothetical protein